MRQLKLPIARKIKKAHGSPKTARPGEHGGERHTGPNGRTGARKQARPFDPKDRLHVTFRAVLARGEGSMIHPKRARVIRDIVKTAGERHGVTVESLVNVGNHLHLMIRTRSKKVYPARLALRGFLREAAGLVARAMTGAKKGRPAAGGKFWDHLAWSRVVRWGRDLLRARKYMKKNELDASQILAEQNWPEWLMIEAMIEAPS